MTGDELLAQLESAAPGVATEGRVELGEPIVVVERDAAREFFRALRDRPELGFNFLIDVTAVDYLGRSLRFELVYELFSLPHNHRLRVKIRLAEADPWVHSLADLWKSANWLEREVWDMFGIRFTGHPDLRRILMYEEFVGHPLRRDYPVGKRQPLTEERDPIARDWKF
jgi:NADH-quinone oxidoreductase subunit C